MSLSFATTQATILLFLSLVIFVEEAMATTAFDGPFDKYHKIRHKIGQK